MLRMQGARFALLIKSIQHIASLTNIFRMETCFARSNPISSGWTRWPHGKNCTLNFFRPFLLFSRHNMHYIWRTLWARGAPLRVLPLNLPDVEDQSILTNILEKQLPSLWHTSSSRWRMAWNGPKSKAGDPLISCDTSCSALWHFFQMAWASGRTASGSRPLLWASLWV